MKKYTKACLAILIVAVATVGMARPVAADDFDVCRGLCVSTPQPAGTIQYDTTDGALHTWAAGPNGENPRDIWIEDHTTAPTVYSIEGYAHTRWDTPTDVQFHYGPCVANRPCIRTYSKNLGTGYDLAYTHGWVVSPGGRLKGVVSITFNDTRIRNDQSPLPQSTVASVVCRELGHGIGLGYERAASDTSKSCMKDFGGSGGFPTTGNSTDFSYVNQMYN